MNKLLLATAAIALAGSMGTAFAGETAAGQAKYAMCIGCHGADGAGNAAAGYPTLKGRDSAFVKDQLTAFRSGARVNATMQAMTASLTDADIDNLAAYVATLK